MLTDSVKKDSTIQQELCDHLTAQNEDAVNDATDCDTNAAGPTAPSAHEEPMQQSSKRRRKDKKTVSLTREQMTTLMNGADYCFRAYSKESVRQLNESIGKELSGPTS